MSLVQDRPNPSQTLSKETPDWTAFPIGVDCSSSVRVIGGFQSQSIRIQDRFGREVTTDSSPSGIAMLVPRGKYSLACEVVNGDRLNAQEIELQFWEFKDPIRIGPVLLAATRALIRPNSTAQVACGKRITAPEPGRHTVYGVKLIAGPFEDPLPAQIDPMEITWTQAGTEGSTALRAASSFVIYRGRPFEWTVGPDLAHSISPRDVIVSSRRIRNGVESALPESAINFRAQDNAGAGVTLIGTAPFDSLPRDMISVKVEIINQPSAGFTERLFVGNEPPCVD